MTDNELLTAISDLLDSKLKSELQPIKDDIGNLKADMNDMKLRISKLEDDVRGIHLHLENVTDKNIQILAENYIPAAKRYIQAAERIDAMQMDIDVLKTTVAKHSEIIQKFA